MLIWYRLGRSNLMRKLLCIDPDITSINVTGITQTSVRVSWFTGRTRVVNSTVVYYRATGATSWEGRGSPSQSTTHKTVSALQPGTQYQFYVKISSYGKSSTSNTVTVTTGKWCYYVHVVYRPLFLCCLSLSRPTNKARIVHLQRWSVSLSA